MLISQSTTDTLKIAQDLANNTKSGVVIGLYGDLGAGKTTFTQGLAQALGVIQPVKSPTFTIMNQYPLPTGKGNFYHLDLYRIKSINDIKSLDLEELIQENIHIIVIEWPEKIADLLPSNTIKIYFKTLSENQRSITIQNHKS